MGREGRPSAEQMGLNPAEIQVPSNVESKEAKNKTEDKEYLNRLRSIYRIRPQSAGLGVKADTWIIERTFGTIKEGKDDKDRIEGNKLTWSVVEIVTGDKMAANKRALALTEGRDSFIVDY